MSFIWRFAGSLALVVATYNPSGYSFFHWVWNSWQQDRLGPEHFVAGALVVAGWSILVVATRRSLSSWGLLIVAAILGGVVWWISSLGLRVTATTAALTWVILISVALLLTVGLSWSHIWRRVTGQYEVDEVNG